MKSTSVKCIHSGIGGVIVRGGAVAGGGCGGRRHLRFASFLSPFSLVVLVLWLSLYVSAVGTGGFVVGCGDAGRLLLAFY